MPDRETHYQIYADRSGEWRWRLVAVNGKVIADSGEGYKNYTDCWDAIQLVAQTDAETPITNATL